MTTKNLWLCLATTTVLLGGCSAMSPKYKYKETPPTLRLTLLPYDTAAVGKTVTVDAKLTDIKTAYIIKDRDLEEKHTRKVHLLVIDPTLTDYQHIHPTATSTSGVYQFKFSPKKPGNYRVWADVTPVATKTQQFVSADLGQRKPATIDKTESNEATVDGYKFKLSFDKPPVEGDESLGTIDITDSKGKPVATLQPLMGAYSHIVGFYDDYRTIVHTHPMGAEPTSDKERGTTPLTFHLMPVKAGFVKLFAQVVIDNKEIYVPFGITVSAAK